jgi:dephospho-CoA kinase
MKYRLIGISGTNGAGKDTVGHILVDRFDYLFVSVTDSLRAEARRRGIEPARENLRIVSADWRREFGLSVLVNKTIEHYAEAVRDTRGLAMASLRNPAEADRIHELGGIVLWIDADPRIRFKRVRANAFARDRAAEDNKTFEQFIAEEQAEMHRSAGADAATLDMSAVKDRSDFTIVNEYNTTDGLADELARVLELS